MKLYEKCLKLPHEQPYKLRSQNARDAKYFKTAVAMVDDFKAQGNIIFVSSTLFNDIYLT
jgi:hypothetical protein